MTEPFFGELYLRSTRPFLSADTTAAEAKFLQAQLPGQRLLDLGCGHGRHLAHVRGFGVDRDPLSLVEAVRHAPVSRADLRRLPFRAGAFDGVWCWYNSIGTFEDDQLPLILAETARCTRPGGRLVIQGTNISRSRAQPLASYDGPIGQGDHLREWAEFDFVKKRDQIHRELTCDDGRVMEADFFIRYYEVDEWRRLLDAAGYQLAWSMGGLDGAPVDDSSMDVIIGAERRGA
ncbi:MAG: class I SAM-dependent methyltransferase [Archangium sp.]